MKISFRKRFLLCLMVAAVMLQAMLVLSSCTPKSGNEDFTLPTRKLAEDAPVLEYGMYKYQVYDDGTVILTEYKGSESALTIPDKIDGKPVIALANGLFKGITSIQTLRLGKNIEIIGEICFADCTSLYDIKFNDKLWSIGSWAFYNTPWLNTQSDEFVVVGDSVLIKYNGSSPVITIPDNVKHIVDAFEGATYLVSVDLGDNLLTVGDYAFAHCDNLRLVRFGKSIRSIGSYAFNECGALTSLVLPDSLESIGAYAFNYCGAITSADLGKGLRIIGNDAFYSCVRLKVLTFSTSLTEIGTYAFKECNSIMLVYYDGTEAQLEAISGLSDNVTNSTVWNARKILTGTTSQ